MSGITTHVLDTSVGLPAAGVAVALERRSDGDGWLAVGHATTDDVGRVRVWRPDPDVIAGAYRLVFDTRRYFAARAIDSFFPSVTIEFTIADVAAHYHVPLLLSPFGYSTYRGS